MVKVKLNGGEMVQLQFILGKNLSEKVLGDLFYRIFDKKKTILSNSSLKMI